MRTTSSRERGNPRVCPKCASERTRIVGQAGQPAVAFYRCDACEYVFTATLTHDGAPRVRAAVAARPPQDAVRDLLSVLDVNLNELLFRLYRIRQALADVQRGGDGVLLGLVAEALASVTVSERLVAETQQRTTRVRADLDA
jgi:hypothetical protein